MQPTTVCFGEMLWDIFPDGAKPGGAPMNVAYHLGKAGMESYIISRTGTDERGHALRQQLQQWGLPTDMCQTDPQYPTGTVIATAGADHEMSYDIIKPAAWDYIAWEPAQIPLLQRSAAFVFGSLATRNTVSLHTLQQLLRVAPYKVFDVNERPPHSDMEIIRHLMFQTSLVKMNQSELQALLAAEGMSYSGPAAGAEDILQIFPVDEVIVTLGSQGAFYMNHDMEWMQPAEKVMVKDTVGSGDSFLAGFLAKRLRGASVEEAMAAAAKLSAFVTTQEGACPDYDPAFY
ncbi:carbohydrate kinase family protein [Chitinophaga solisilvae]|uniref:carbohydrate kinase family protein n=1 Tax=Chitinophaga solisilvae TaxID=1233460 RepID=UPI0013700252|nr:carbohydrate kinase [Chitinophaga solisilvae]